MAFDAKVIKILIASPGDVEEERSIIPEVISRWNNINAETTSVVLLPVKWETHSAPRLGDRAQGIINNQLVDSCDMVIGVFWTRLGSPTGVSESGTAEEIECFIKKNKPVMVYFSSRAIDPKKIDLKQYQALSEFSDRLQSMGLTGSYSSITDLSDQLFTQLTINVRDFISGAGYTPPSRKEVIENQETLAKILKKDSVYIEDYEKNGEVKSFIVKGDTKEIKDEIKELGGKWNRSLGGWLFPMGKKIEVAAFLKKRV